MILKVLTGESQETKSGGDTCDEGLIICRGASGITLTWIKGWNIPVLELDFDLELGWKP